MPPPDRPTRGAVALAFARVFAHPDADLVLDHLRRQTLGLATGPDYPDHALRHLEGQRFLVNSILNLIEEGKNG